MSQWLLRPRLSPVLHGEHSVLPSLISNGSQLDWYFTGVPLDTNGGPELSAWLVVGTSGEVQKRGGGARDFELIFDRPAFVLDKMWRSVV